MPSVGCLVSVDWLWDRLGANVCDNGGRQRYWIYIIVGLDIDGTPVPSTPSLPDVTETSC